MSIQPEYFAFYADGEIKKFTDIDSAIASDCLFALEQIYGTRENYGYTNAHYTFNFYDKNGGPKNIIEIGKWKIANFRTFQDNFYKGLNISMDIVDPEGALRRNRFGKTDESFAYNDYVKSNFLSYLIRLKKLYNWDQYDLVEENKSLKLKIKNLEAEKEKLETKLKELESKE